MHAWKAYCVILTAMLVGDGHIAKIAAIYRRVVGASLNRRVIDAVRGHVSIHQTLKLGVVGRKTLFDVLDAADAGEAGGRRHRCASEK
jgi:hypothetical protein